MLVYTHYRTWTCHHLLPSAILSVSCLLTLCVQLLPTPGLSHSRGPAWPSGPLELLLCVCTGQFCLLLLPLPRCHLLRGPWLTTHSWMLPFLLSVTSLLTYFLTQTVFIPLLILYLPPGLYIPKGKGFFCLVHC